MQLIQELFVDLMPAVPENCHVSQQSLKEVDVKLPKEYLIGERYCQAHAAKLVENHRNSLELSELVST